MQYGCSYTFKIYNYIFYNSQNTTLYIHKVATKLVMFAINGT